MLERCGRPQQRDVGRDAVTQHRSDVEFRMPRHAGDVLERRPAGLVELDQLVVRAGKHAMRCGEHEFARERNAGA